MVRHNECNVSLSRLHLEQKVAKCNKSVLNIEMYEGGMYEGQMYKGGMYEG